MHRLLIVSDHPSLHRGFSTIGHHFARGLQGTGRWTVDYIGRYPPARELLEQSYRVFDADTDVDSHDHKGDSAAGFVRTLTENVSSAEPRTPLLSIGSFGDQRILLNQIEELGIRKRVQFVAYMPIDSAPLSPKHADFLQRVDIVVPFTRFASRTARALFAAGGGPIVSGLIPHGVDKSVFQPPDPAARRDFRHRFFGVDDESTLIGFFGRNTGHKHSDLALRIFDIFAGGRYVRCHACRRITAFNFDPIDGSGHAPLCCPWCRSGDLEQGQKNRAARFYMHTELLSRVERAYSEGWDLELLATRLGISDQVIFDRSIRIGEGASVVELARRMGACDVHLLPFGHAGWELTVLETAACGVPNVITDFAGPPEYAAPFAELVPTSLQLFGADGTRGVIDLGRSVEALLRVLNEPDHRRRLSRRGIEVARAHDWESVIAPLDRLLSAAVSGSDIQSKVADLSGD